MGLLRERLPGLGGRSEAPVEAGGTSAHSHSRTEERGNILEKRMSRGEAGGVLSQATSCEGRVMWADMSRLLTSRDRRAVIKPCLGQKNCPVRQGLRDFRRA